MLYEPTRPDRYLWDTWLVPAEGRYHLFHMQKVAGETDSLEIGHVVSDDLVRWTMLDPALTLGPLGSWDRFRFRTGTVVSQGGRYYLFYGAAPEMIDRVGVATSTDLVHWERFAGNPIAEADPRWYEHDASSRPTGAVAWRDPCIVRDGDEWVMYLAARSNHGPTGGRGTIATLRSRDLLRWDVGQPLDVPAGYAVMEVPDVFELDGRWFLLHSTSHRMGTRFPTCDPALTAGTFVLWAKHRDGPYERPPRDVLVGSPAHRMTAYVCRTVETPLGRLAYYHNAYPRSSDGAARRGTFGRPRGSFALPKALAVDDRGLQLRYLPLLEPYRGRALAPPLVAAEPTAFRTPPGEWDLRGDAAEGRVEYGTSACLLEGEALDALITATVTIEAGQAAGIGVRVGEQGRALAVIVDTRAGEIAVVEAVVSASGVVWQSLASRHAPIRTATPLRLRLVVLRDTLDVFLDDELMLSVVAEGYGAGRLALIADDSRVRFAGISAHSLMVRAPDEVAG
jgi:beta-fructofuranosidase